MTLPLEHKAIKYRGDVTELKEQCHHNQPILSFSWNIYYICMYDGFNSDLFFVHKLQLRSYDDHIFPLYFMVEQKFIVIIIN